MHSNDMVAFNDFYTCPGEISSPGQFSFSAHGINPTFVVIIIMTLKINMSIVKYLHSAAECLH